MDALFIISNAIVLASIYGTLAIGISITWSSLGLVNLAYGFVFAFAGYGAWLVAQHISQWGPVVLGAGIASGSLAGIIICALAFIPIHDKPNFTIRGLIATLAINLLGTQSLLWWFGPRSKSLPEIFGTWKITLPGMVLTADKVGNVATSVLMLFFVLRWMQASRRGLEIRAMMMNPHAASIVGIGVRRTAFYVMAITGGLAGLAAVLLSQTYYIGLGSVRGAVIAAILLGLNEALTSAFFGGQYVLITQFLFIIAILLVRPRGIAGILDRAREA